MFVLAATSFPAAAERSPLNRNAASDQQLYTLEVLNSAGGAGRRAGGLQGPAAVLKYAPLGTMKGRDLPFVDVMPATEVTSGPNN